MSHIVDCLKDLQSRVQSSAVAKGAKIVSTPEELASMIKQVGTDLEIGVVYQGTSSISDGSGATQKGIGAKAQFGLYLAFQVSTVSQEGEARKLYIIETLDTLRKALLATQAPSGHKWEFVSEGFADTIGARSIWLQQWRTTVVK